MGFPESEGEQAQEDVEELHFVAGLSIKYWAD